MNCYKMVSKIRLLMNKNTKSQKCSPNPRLNLLRYKNMKLRSRRINQLCSPIYQYKLLFPCDDLQ